MITEIGFSSIRWAPRGSRAVLSNTPTVSIRQTALLAIHTHLDGDHTRERGGFIAGRSSRSNGSKTRVVIDDYLPALRATGTPTRLEIPPEDFFSAQERVDGDQLNMLGWVHSHPNLGVFLSSYDQFLWSSFFGRPYQLAIVIDPVKADGAVYGRTQGDQYCTVKLEISEIRDLIEESQLRWSGYRRR
jgi:proteasome lid subunit RPN8/RPN11